MKEIEHGIVPVMMQPFNYDGSPDWDGLGELIEFYLSSGAVALFAACGSTEISHLAPSEVLEIVRRTIALVDGRVPVIAGAIRSDVSVEKQAEFICEVADLGADFVAITASMMVGETDGEQVFLAQIDRILELTGDIPLAIYESPVPYHRLMPPETLRELARTGRFFFHKDTCCNAAMIRQKVEAVSGTPLRFFNAHTPSLFDSLRAGAAGYSGVGTNFFPELLAELCGRFASDPERAAKIQHFLDAVDPLLANDDYPQTAKMFLQNRGLGITSQIRQDRSVSFSGACDLVQAAALYADFVRESATLPSGRVGSQERVLVGSI